ncbi:MAG: hypothetical protein L0H25_03085 [Micrococcales bacterium]|nr:hypothetical protein [Micrococcales bacterium]
MIMHLRAAVEQLYAAPLADFVSERTSLVAQARTAGDVALATSVAALRKPTVAAWAINHAVRSELVELDELHGFAELLREAQRTLDGDQLRLLGRERAKRVETVAAQVVASAKQAGHPLGPGAAAEVRETLTALVADEEAERAIRSGALVKALSYAGFGSVDIADIAEAAAVSGDELPQAVTPAIDLAEQRQVRQEQRRARRAAELESARRARAKVEHEIDVAEARRSEAREGVADLERRLAAARDRLERVTAELTELGGIRDRRVIEERAAQAALTSEEHERA